MGITIKRPRDEHPQGCFVLTLILLK